MEIRKTFKYRLYPKPDQAAALDVILWRCRDLYNAALFERREAWRLRHTSLTAYDQINELPAMKVEAPEYQAVPSHVLQDVLRRLDKAFQAFFRRVQASQTPGFPRFQGRSRYDSFTYPDAAGWKLAAGRLVLSGIGSVRVRWHRELQGTIKTVTVRREADQWYVSFSCVVDLEPAPALPAAATAAPASAGTEAAAAEVGIDLGLLHFVTLSTGEQIDHPRYFRRAQKRLAAAQQKLSRGQKRQRGKPPSKRREQARIAVARAHRRVRNQRADFHHKLARRLVNEHELIAFEELQIRSLSKRPQAKVDADKSAAAGETVYAPNGAAAKAGLNKSILDAGWGQFQQMCVSKAAWAGRTVVFVDPAYTSQNCSRCGHRASLTLDQRWYSCPECGLELDRDHNAALNILRAGKRLASISEAAQAQGEAQMPTD